MEEVLIYVPLKKYEDGVKALARIETLKSLTINNKYGISRECIADVLGFKLPEKED